MIKKVVVFGLGWQGKQFIKYFKKNNYEVLGICKTKNTKLKIEKEFLINVSINYKELLTDKIDLLVLSAYPIDIYEEILEYSLKYNFKILSDLPITFNISLLKRYYLNDNIFFFLIETQNIFFNSMFFDDISNIRNIECLILQNRNNLKSQRYKKKSIIVDTHYVLNNLLLFKQKGILEIKYKFIDRIIKDIEYFIKINFINGDNIIYKHENGKGIIIKRNKSNDILNIKEEKIIFDNILDNYIININNNNNFYKKEYYSMYSYLLKKLNYEKK